MARSVKSMRAQAYDNLSVMISSGVLMHRALGATVGGVRGPLRRAMSAMESAVGQGEKLSAEMRHHPHAFTDMDVMFIEAGETSGHLDRCLKLLGEWHNFCDRLRRLFVAGMLFPLMIFHAAALLIPLSSLFLGHISLGDYIWSVVRAVGCVWAAILLVVVIVKWTPQTGIARVMLDRLSLKIPLLASALYHLALSRYCRAFNMLYCAGVRSSEATDSATRATTNAVVRKLLAGAGDSVRAGELMSKGFSRKLSPDFIAAWETGEESGMLDRASERLANSSADTAEFKMQQFVNWLPKIMYVAVCIWIVIGIFQGLSIIPIPV